MKKETMYLDYVNNFLTVERFAEYYNISTNEANDIINKGRILHNFKSMKKYVIEKNNFQGFIITSLNKEGRSYYTGKTVEEMQQEYKNELIAVNDEELDLIIKEYENSLQKEWQEISEEEYFDALECLPPMNWRTITSGVNVFCISEGYYGSLHSHFLKLTNSEGVKYYSALRCIYTTTNEQILEQIKKVN